MTYTEAKDEALRILASRLNEAVPGLESARLVLRAALVVALPDPDPENSREAETQLTALRNGGAGMLELGFRRPSWRNRVLWVLDDLLGEHPDEWVTAIERDYEAKTGARCVTPESLRRTFRPLVV